MQLLVSCIIMIHLESLKNNIMAKILHFRHIKAIIKMIHSLAVSQGEGFDLHKINFM